MSHHLRHLTVAIIVTGCAQPSKKVRGTIQVETNKKTRIDRTPIRPPPASPEAIDIVEGSPVAPEKDSTSAGETRLSEAVLFDGACPTAAPAERGSMATDLYTGQAGEGKDGHGPLLLAWDACRRGHENSCSLASAWLAAEKRPRLIYSLNQDGCSAGVQSSCWHAADIEARREFPNHARTPEQAMALLEAGCDQAECQPCWSLAEIYRVGTKAVPASHVLRERVVRQINNIPGCAP